MSERIYVKSCEELEKAKPGLNPRGTGRWGLTPRLVVLWRLMGDAGLTGRELPVDEFKAGLKRLDELNKSGDLKAWSDGSVQQPAFFWTYYGAEGSRDQRIFQPTHYKLIK